MAEKQAQTQPRQQSKKPDPPSQDVAELLILPRFLLSPSAIFRHLLDHPNLSGNRTSVRGEGP